MKKFFTIVLLCSIFTGCTSKTQFGPCIGAFDDPNPKLEYKMSALNLSIAILFMGLVVPPVYVLVNETRCPVGNK